MLFQKLPSKALGITLCFMVTFSLLTGCSSEPSSQEVVPATDGSKALLKELASSLPKIPENLDFESLANSRFTEISSKNISYSSEAPTFEFDAQNNRLIILSGRATLEDIHYQFGEETVEKHAGNSYLLKTAIVITGGYLQLDGVTLTMDADSLTYYQDNLIPVYILLQEGFLSIVSSDITSTKEDLKNGELRPFIWSAGEDGSCFVEIRNSEITNLGFDKIELASGDLLPERGSWGLSFYENTFLRVTDSIIHDNYMGLFIWEIEGGAVSNCTIYNNDSYGLDVHDYTKYCLFSGNEIYSNGNHGLILSKYCTENIISENNIYNHNAMVKDWNAHGLMLHEGSDNNILWNNTLTENYNGLNIHASSGNIIMGNTITHDVDYGIKIWKNSENNLFINNSVTLSELFDLMVEDSAHNLFIGCELGGGGVYFKNSTENVYINNNAPLKTKGAEENLIIQAANPLDYYRLAVSG